MADRLSTAPAGVTSGNVAFFGCGAIRVLLEKIEDLHAELDRERAKGEIWPLHPVTHAQFPNFRGGPILEIAIGGQSAGMAETTRAASGAAAFKSPWI
jgi:hypothetical protein